LQNEIEAPEDDSEEAQVSVNEISTLNYARGTRTEQVNTPCTVMMVAEKPSIALSIAESLSNNFEKKMGLSKGIPIYTFSGKF
jgi:hypothetical protein